MARSPTQESYGLLRREGLAVCRSMSRSLLFSSEKNARRPALKISHCRGSMLRYSESCQ